MNRLSLITRHLSQIPIPKSQYTLRTTHRAISTTTPRTMLQYTGSCYCRNIKYEISLSSPDEARSSLCHCSNCKKAFGTNYGLTAKIPKDAFKLTAGKPKEHVGDNGSGSLLHREFCDNCGSFILEYGDAVKDQARYICVGTLDDPEALPPKGEFFCSQRASWMPEIPNVFHKQKIKE